MYDDSRQYLGYRLSFTAAGTRYEAEVTRAASRVLPTELFPPTVLLRAAGEWLAEIPPESGSVPGGSWPPACRPIATPLPVPEP